MSKPKTIMIDDVKYIREDSVNQKAESVDGMEYCVIRTYSAGVHIGYVKERKGQDVTLVNARRLWKWENAATLSQVAVDGCKSQKFTVAVPVITLTDAVEIIPCTDKAKKVLDSIAEWKA